MGIKKKDKEERMQEKDIQIERKEKKRVRKKYGPRQIKDRDIQTLQREREKKRVTKRVRKRYKARQRGSVTKILLKNENKMKEGIQPCPEGRIGLWLKCWKRP